MKIPSFTRNVLAAFLLLMTAAAVHADDMYKTPAKEDAVQWIAVVYAVVFLIAVAVVAFKNAKRTHLD